MLMAPDGSMSSLPLSSICDQNGFHSTSIDVITYKVGTVGEREERKNLGNLFVLEDLALRKLYLGPNLRPSRCAAQRNVKDGVVEGNERKHTKWLKSTNAIPKTSGPLVGWMIRDSGRAFLEYDVDEEPNDATLSLSLFEGKLVEDGGDETKNVAEGGNGVDKDFSISCIDGAMLDSGDSPSSYLRAKKLLSSASNSEAGELVSVSVV